MIIAVRDRARFAGTVLFGLMFVATPLLVSSPAAADVIGFFNMVAGNPNGEFGWDDFGTTGSPYQGPHATDQFTWGNGQSLIEVTPGGMITGTNNLYSFFSVPTWDFSMSSLDSSAPFTSLVLQISSSAELDGNNFSLGGLNPDEFVDLGQRTEIGGFPYNFYWAEWQGLSAAPSLGIQVFGTGQHQSLAGAQLTYFNTTSSFNINSVPEPGSAGIVAGLLACVATGFRRRRSSHGGTGQ